MIGLVALAKIVWHGVRSFLADERSRGLLLLTLSIIGAGAVFYRQVENFSWVDSFYFTIVTLTTVGYGDLSPQTTAGKLFTMAYLLIGIGILVALITEVARHVIDAGQADSTNDIPTEK